MYLKDLFSLRGKTAIVTGGNRMYGKDAAAALAEAGARVWIACRTRETSEAAATEITQSCISCGSPGSARFVELHQESPVSIDRMIDTVLQADGRVDILVTAARAIPAGADGWNQEEASLREAVRVNSTGWLYLTQKVGEAMIRQRSGSILSFGSMMGLVGVEKHNYDNQPGMGSGAYAHDYALNKSGILGWTRTAASYYGRFGVRVNAVCPGGLASDRTPPVFAANYGRHTQLGRLASDDDIKGAVVLLASDAGAYLTGLSLPVDGGYTMI